MNYELAKQLKDAGFPQTSDTGYVCDLPEYEGHPRLLTADATGFYSKPLSQYYGYVAVPTLPELIDACGDNLVFWKFGNKWCAGILAGDPYSGYSEIYIDDYPNHTQVCPTLEEATANLYLALKTPVEN